MVTRSKGKSNESSVDAPQVAFKIGNRVVVYTRHNVRVPGLVRWVGKVTVSGVDFTAVGIETVSVECLLH